MSGGRIGAIAGRILRQFRHDPRSVALIAVVPLVVMALIGYLISGRTEPLPVAFVNGEAAQGQAGVGALFEQALRADPGISLRSFPNAAAAERAVRGGDVSGAIEVPAGFTSALRSGAPVAIRVALQGVDTGVDGPVLRAAASGLTRLLGSAQARAAGLSPPRVSVRRVSLLGLPRLKTLDFSAPALIVVFAFLFTFMLTSVAFLRERSSGTLSRLMASPVSRFEVIGGYLLGFLGFAMMQALLVLGYVVWILHVRVAGAVWIVLVVLALLVIGVVNLGIALSFFARNELQVVQFIPLILLPQVFLGGLFWPVQTLAPPLRWLSQVFPITHAVAGLRAVMVGGGGFGDVAGRLGALVVFAAAMTLLGVLALRNQRA